MGHLLGAGGGHPSTSIRSLSGDIRRSNAYGQRAGNVALSGIGYAGTDNTLSLGHGNFSFSDWVDDYRGTVNIKCLSFRKSVDSVSGTNFRTITIEVALSGSANDISGLDGPVSATTYKVGGVAGVDKVCAGAPTP